MALADLASGYLAAQAALARAVVEAALALWAGLDRRDPTGSWTAQRTGERLFLAVSTGQLAVAEQAPVYVARAVTEQRATSAPAAAVRPMAFAGVASDGRELDSLLLQPLIQAEAAITQGATPERAMQVGQFSLTTIAATQVQDAGRAAVQVAMAAEPAVTGYVRMLSPPSCARCVILAGRFYKRNAGFDRHERCDCIAIPATEDVPDDLTTNPETYFQSLDKAEQDRVFTKAGAEAIRLGADMRQVVNARRGAAGLSRPGQFTEAEQRVFRGGRDRGRLQRTDVYGRQLFITDEGVTVHGQAGKRLAAGSGTRRGRSGGIKVAKAPRLMPESIFELAGNDRDEQVRLLRRFGYMS